MISCILYYAHHLPVNHPYKTYNLIYEGLGCSKYTSKGLSDFLSFFVSQNEHQLPRELLKKYPCQRLTTTLRYD